MAEEDRGSSGTSSSPRNQSARFESYSFDLAGGLLLKDGAEVVLPPRAARLLACLLEHPGKLVPKDTLITSVWNGVAVSDQSLAEAISQLRHALEDDPAAPTYIQTVHRRGYRFIAPVSRTSPEPVAYGGIEGTAEPTDAPGSETMQPRQKARLLVGFAALAVLAVGGAVMVRPWMAETGGVADQLEEQQQQLARIEEEMRSLKASLFGSSPTAEHVWQGASLAWGASPSPDGRLIAYGDAGPAPSLYRIATGETTALARQGDALPDPLAMHPVFSRDGRYIAYRVLDRTGTAAPELRIAEVDGGEPMTIRRGQDALIPHAWSPDGNYLFGTESDDAGLRIVRASVHSGQTTTLATLEGRPADGPRKLSLSPDGRTLAYDFKQADGSGRRDIYLLPIAGGTPTLVVRHTANDLLPMWTPDGAGLLFISDRSGDYTAWVVHLEDNRIEGPEGLMRLGTGSMISPLGLTNDGSLFYGAGSGPRSGSDVHVVELDPHAFRARGGPRRVVPSYPGLNLGPTWSPDGQRLAYLSQRGLFYEPDTVIAINVVSGGAAETVHQRTTGLRYIRNPRWSPGGRSILVRGYDEEMFWGLYLIDVLTMETTAVVREEEPGPSSISPGGRWLSEDSGFVYARDRREPARDPQTGKTRQARTQTLWSHELNSHRERVLHRVVEPELLASWTMSPDGDDLFVSVYRPRGDSWAFVLRRIPVDGGPPEELLRVSAPRTIRDLEWCAGDRILFTTPDGDGDLSKPRDVWAVSARGGTAERIGISLPGARNIACDPAGARVALVANTQESRTDVWRLRNFVRTNPANPDVDASGRGKPSRR